MSPLTETDLRFSLISLTISVVFSYLIIFSPAPSKPPRTKMRGILDS